MNKCTFVAAWMLIACEPGPVDNEQDIRGGDPTAGSPTHTGELTSGDFEPDTFCAGHPEKDERIACSNETLALDEKDSYAWCWVFADGYAICDVSKDKKVDVHDMVVDVTCDARYDLNGYPDREQPDPELGDPAVLARSSLKLQVQGDGAECKVVKSCCDASPVWQ